MTRKTVKMGRAHYNLLFILLVACNSGDSKVSNALPPTDADTGLKWTDYREGELPPVGYYDALDSVIKKWNIRYERIEGGCEPAPLEKRRYEKGNGEYFQLLEKQYGKDWRRRFDDEVKTVGRYFDKINADHTK